MKDLLNTAAVTANATRNRRFRLARTGAAAVLALAAASTAHAETFIPTSGTQSYNVPANWSPANVPNSVGASAIFNSPTAAETANLSAAITVGSISLTNDSTFAFTLANGTGGSLTLDQTGTANATITVNGTGNVVNTISATTTLNDNLLVTVNNVATTSSSGALTLTGGISGAGGLTKEGAGRLTLSTTAKTYTGATVVNAGILRTSATGGPNATSAITVNSGGQFRLDSNTGTFGFGTATITINGTGDTSSTGALRNQGSGANTLSNNIAVASDSTIHVDGSSASLTANGTVSGTGAITKTGGGTLVLTAANAALTGGTTLTNGTVTVNSGSRLGGGALSFAQTTLNNTAVTLNNATQSVSALSSAFVDTTGTQTQTLTLTGTALTVNQATNTTFGVGAVSTLTSVITGTGSVAKSGAGTLNLTDANTYTGGTSITGGKLLVSNATGTSATGTGAVSIGTAGTLASGAGTTGAISGLVSTVGTGSILAPGATAASNTGTVGALTLSAGLNLAAGGTIPFDLLTPSTSDLIRLTAGTFTGGTLPGSVTFQFATTATTGTFALINFSGATASGVDLTDFVATGALGTFSFNGNELDFTIAAVPEPGTIAAGLLALGTLGYSQRRRVRGFLALARRRTALEARAIRRSI